AAANAVPHRECMRLESLANDLSACRFHSAARAAAERPTVLGRLQPYPDRALLASRPRLPRLFPGSLAARRHCGSYEARGPQTPRAGERDRTAWAAAGLAPLIRAQRRADVTGRSRQRHRFFR